MAMASGSKGSELHGRDMARVSSDNGIELVDDRSGKIEAAGSMTPEDAAATLVAANTL
jgi:hypothetical protein